MMTLMTSFKLQGAKKTKFWLTLGASSTYDVLAWKSFKKKLWGECHLAVDCETITGDRTKGEKQ